MTRQTHVERWLANKFGIRGATVTYTGSKFRITHPVALEPLYLHRREACRVATTFWIIDPAIARIANDYLERTAA